MLLLPAETEDSFPFADKWILAIRAVNRTLPDQATSRLYCSRELAEAIEVIIAETPLPQLQTLGWMRDVLLQVARGSKKRPAWMTRANG
jgi:hypothetical protein